MPVNYRLVDGSQWGSNQMAEVLMKQWDMSMDVSLDLWHWLHVQYMDG